MSIIVVSALLSKRVKQKGIEEFSVSSKSLNLFPLICSVAASHIGSGLSLGLIGMMYLDGVQVIWIAIGHFSGALIYTLVLGKKIRKKADASGWGITKGDLLEEHYGRKGRFLFGGIAAWERIAVTSGQLVAAGVLLSTILAQFNINLTTATIIVGALVIINVSFGGLSAVIWADVIQMFIMVLGIGLLLPIILTTKLEPGTLMAATDAGFYNLAPTNMVVLGTAAAWFTSALANQTVWSRIVSAKNAKTAVQANVIGSVVGIAWGLVMVYITFAIKAIYPNIQGNPDSFLLNTILDGFPIVIIGLIMAALLANILSTANTVLLHAVMNITHDLYNKTFKRNASNEEILTFAKISTPIIGIAPAILGIFIPKIIEVQNLGYNFYGAAITAPFWASMLFPNKVTPIAGFSAMIVGGSVSLFFYFTDLTMIPNAILGVVASFITLLIVSKFTKGTINENHQSL
ncbi:sodium:solute symporter family protein [Siminovitchia acidinfaciens]|uniref:Sodium:solute symporter family protein n=1 Tax=Siminovitchia acidinfaciens TaxID=2321395 RepID=A0A429XZD8_9BACI|nr:sodium:solute symporter family protein [Siminovitchia acidinfaciens]